MDEEAARLVGRLGDRAELRAELAGPLATAVVATALGLDGRDEVVVGRLLGWYREIVASVAGIGAGLDPTDAGEAAMAALGAAVGEHLTEHGGLSSADSLSNAAVIMFGGIETTEGMILNALWFLLRDEPPGVPSPPTPALAVGAVEESLRLEPAAAVVDRYATRDVDLPAQPSPPAIS